VLYEMLTAQAAFEGETIGEILAGVFKAEPDWRRLPAETPEAIRRLLRRCLQKDRTRRLNSPNAVRIEIEEALSGPAIAPPKVDSYTKRRLSWILAAIWTLAFASTAIVYFRQQPQPEMRVEITTPSTAVPFEFTLSPDGQYIVFVASGDGPQRLWLRALDKTEAQPMAGTEGADYPFWSPDSRLIGFTAAGKLKRIDIAGGLPQVLANSSVIRSGAWNADGTTIQGNVEVWLMDLTRGGMTRFTVDAVLGAEATLLWTKTGQNSSEWRFRGKLKKIQEEMTTTRGAIPRRRT
jgi:eukaryotic-like serine/threonine-protein kinase